jgi:hypothetical protein
MTHWKRSTSLSFILIHNEMKSFVAVQFIAENMFKLYMILKKHWTETLKSLNILSIFVIVLDLRRWNWQEARETCIMRGFIICTVYQILFIHSSMALQPFVGPWSLLQFRDIVYTDGRTPWISDLPVAKPLLPTKDKTVPRMGPDSIIEEDETSVAWSTENLKEEHHLLNLGIAPKLILTFLLSKESRRVWVRYIFVSVGIL